MFGRRKTVPFDQIDPGEPPRPTEELFISRYQLYQLGTLETDEAAITLEGIDPIQPFVQSFTTTC